MASETAALSDHFPPRPGRCHEVCGAGAPAFAAIALGARGGAALWICGTWRADRLYPEGVAPFCDPAKLLIAEVDTERDMLASAEEALRSGAVTAVVAEPQKPLDLTAGRRLQLAAEAGGSLGLMLIAEGAGSNAAESRWRCAPQSDSRFHRADSTRQTWALIKNKTGILKSWNVCWDAKTHSIAVVPPSGE
ncbi:MAG: hypothetical protein AAGI70_16150 [Pseudomonadota bacterium]